MFDSWNGEHGFLRVDNEEVWKLNGKTPSNKNAMNFGGSETPDPRYNSLIDVTFAHTDDTVNLEFGSSLIQNPCKASYGIDDVQILVK